MEEITPETLAKKAAARAAKLESMTPEERKRHDEMEASFWGKLPQQSIPVEPAEHMTVEDLATARRTAKIMFGRELADEELKELLYVPVIADAKLPYDEREITPHVVGGSVIHTPGDAWRECPMELLKIRQRLWDNLVRDGVRMNKSTQFAKLGRLLIRMGDWLIDL